MTAIYIREYRGYRHNRYDGYECSWGVLIALGASPIADCFADGDDYPDDDFNRAYKGEDSEIGDGNNSAFREDVLQNLEIADFSEITDLESGGSFEHYEYWGDNRFIIMFKRDSSGKLWCNFDDQVSEFEVTV